MRDGAFMNVEVWLNLPLHVSPMFVHKTGFGSASASSLACACVPGSITSYAHVRSGV